MKRLACSFSPGKRSRCGCRSFGHQQCSNRSILDALYPARPADSGSCRQLVAVREARSRLTPSALTFAGGCRAPRKWHCAVPEKKRSSVRPWAIVGCTVHPVKRAHTRRLLCDATLWRLRYGRSSRIKSVFTTLYALVAMRRRIS